MEDVNKQKTHKISISNRRTCNISGVSDVLSFDVKEVILETEMGMLMMKGTQLHVNRLTLEKGEIDIEGSIDSITYSEAVSGGKQNESILSKLFR
ncbi:MAG: sporulation protein YabP [Clostridia bacterium]|nr:sporulation protein YabP [Clostridia bacterium]